MFNDKTLVLLHCPAGGGHRAAAQALAECARSRDIDVRVIDALSYVPRWFAKLYVETHLQASAHLPTLYGGAYFATNHPVHWGAHAPLSDRLDAWLLGDLVRDLANARTLAVVATHFFPMRALGRARQSGRLKAPVIEVVTDYAAHAVWAEPGADAYCAPEGRACDDLVRLGVAPARVHATGVPVRAAFASETPNGSVSASTPFRVLITSGGFGVGPIERIVRSFAHHHDVQLTVICGHNPELEDHVRWLCGALALNAHVFGFERDMPARLRAADVVVTKPGGLTVSECLAAGRPMVFVGAVPGQETLNQTWVVDSAAGMVARPEDVATVVTTLRSNPNRLRAMSERASALAAPRAANAVLNVVLANELQLRGNVEAFATTNALTRTTAKSRAIQPTAKR